jgi:hypothetical protein
MLSAQIEEGHYPLIIQRFFLTGRWIIWYR